MTEEDLAKWTAPVTRGDMRIVLHRVADLLVDLTEVITMMYKDEDTVITVQKFGTLLKKQKEFLNYIQDYAGIADDGEE